MFTVPGDLLARGDQFFEEARRLLNVGDNSPPSLATIQGLLIFFVRYVHAHPSLIDQTDDSSMVIMGKDRMGWMYLDLATRSAEDYAAAHPPRAPQSEAERVAQNVAHRTLWGIFSFGSCVFLCNTFFFLSPPFLSLYGRARSLLSWPVPPPCR